MKSLSAKVFKRTKDSSSLRKVNIINPDWMPFLWYKPWWKDVPLTSACERLSSHYAESCMHLQSVRSSCCANTPANFLPKSPLECISKSAHLCPVSTAVLITHIPPWDHGLELLIGASPLLWGDVCLLDTDVFWVWGIVTKKKKESPNSPIPKRSSAEQEAFSRCKSKRLKFFGLFPFYQTTHPQGFTGTCCCS